MFGQRYIGHGLSPIGARQLHQAPPRESAPAHLMWSSLFQAVFSISWGPAAPPSDPACQAVPIITAPPRTNFFFHPPVAPLQCKVRNGTLYIGCHEQWLVGNDFRRRTNARSQTAPGSKRCCKEASSLWCFVCKPVLNSCLLFLKLSSHHCIHLASKLERENEDRRRRARKEPKFATVGHPGLRSAQQPFPWHRGCGSRASSLQLPCALQPLASPLEAALWTCLGRIWAVLLSVTTGVKQG